MEKDLCGIPLIESDDDSNWARETFFSWAINPRTGERGAIQYNDFMGNQHLVCYIENVNELFKFIAMEHYGFTEHQFKYIFGETPDIEERKAYRSLFTREKRERVNRFGEFVNDDTYFREKGENI